MLLAGPVCLLLAVSVVGLAVVPFAFCALLLAWIVGKVAVAQRDRNDHRAPDITGKPDSGASILRHRLRGRSAWPTWCLCSASRPGQSVESSASARRCCRLSRATGERTRLRSPACLLLKPPRRATERNRGAVPIRGPVPRTCTGTRPHAASPRGRRVTTLHRRPRSQTSSRFLERHSVTGSPPSFST